MKYETIIAAAIAVKAVSESIRRICLANGIEHSFTNINNDKGAARTVISHLGAASVAGM